PADSVVSDCTKATVFATGSRQFADKRSVARSAPTKTERSRTIEASPARSGALALCVCQTMPP
ncbi:hypothetical protein CU661_30435, partial [Pseudomonas syringae pv. actinidifoliorum]|nr:hypothetical protein [Pseudomonas syringae pv. actinidifoliorum]